MHTYNVEPVRVGGSRWTPRRARAPGVAVHTHHAARATTGRDGTNAGVYSCTFSCDAVGSGAWSQSQKLLASDGVRGVRFGRSVAISGGGGGWAGAGRPKLLPGW